jgi:hypothetical protein
MGGGGSKPSNIGSSILSGISGVTGKVGEIANNPTVQRVGQIASVGATLAGHPEIGAGITGGLTATREIAPVLSDVTGDLSGRLSNRRNNNNVGVYPTRYLPMTATNNPTFNRRIGEMEIMRRERRSNATNHTPTILGGDRSTWSPTPYRR